MGSNVCATALPFGSVPRTRRLGQLLGRWCQILNDAAGQALPRDLQVRRNLVEAQLALFEQRPEDALALLGTPPPVTGPDVRVRGGQLPDELADDEPVEDESARGEPAEDEPVAADTGDLSGLTLSERFAALREELLTTGTVEPVEQVMDGADGSDDDSPSNDWEVKG